MAGSFRNKRNKDFKTFWVFLLLNTDFSTLWEADSETFLNLIPLEKHLIFDFQNIYKKPPV